MLARDHHAELVVRNSASGLSVAEIFLFTLPTALTVTIPMGALVGILLGLASLTLLVRFASG